MGAVRLDVVARIDRENCSRTKHDPSFSKWQVLVGPSDWEDHSLGKEGVARYRVHNLPTVTGPGLYELGIAVSSTRKLDSDGVVVVVYIGQADNVRMRLQCYGHSGAHLNNPNHCGLKSEPGLFEDIFRRGYPIVYRWAPMKSKADALKVEAQLLSRFDYAWNKGSNVRRRHDDVLKKLNKVPSRNIKFPKFIRKIICFSQKPMGIEIKETKQLSLEQEFSNYVDEKSNNFLPQVFKFSKSQPKLVLDRQGAEDRTLNYIKKNSPEMYKAGRVVSSERSEVSLPFNIICGVELGDGYLCSSQPVMGRLRCEEHKGLKVNGKFSRSDEKVNTHVYGEDSNSSTFDDRKYGSSVCGARTLGGSYCTRRPVKGNTSCWQHSAQVSDSRDSTISSSNVSGYGGASLCGASTQNGSYCSREVKGGGRCWQHSVHAQVKGGPGLLPSLHVSYRDSSISSRNDWKREGTSPCGASTRNGRNRDPLEWSAIQKIAVGAARGLRYLHEECRVGCIVHRDMRPYNILRTHDFEPLVGDFGPARWQPDGDMGVETRVIGTFGYLAPEYAQSGQITEKADVYSFGVLLVELITGRKAMDINRSKGQQCLTEWARHLLQRRAIAELVDPCLRKCYSEREVYGMLQCAFMCICRDPHKRPRMSQVLRMLEGDIVMNPTTET